MQIIQGLAAGQVLQRRGLHKGAKAEIAGSADSAGPVLATISDQGGFLKGWKRRAIGKSSGGRFAGRLTDIPAGGPYRLTLEIGRDRAAVEEFFVGDVWLLAGQSNMEGVGERKGAAIPHPLVRTLTMARRWRLATDRLHVLAESPDFCHNNGIQLSPQQAEEVRNHAVKGVGVGVFFGKEMFARSGVPQGLICTAHGGTSMDQWNPILKKQGGRSLYGSMLASWKITGQPIAGVLWYQGESDAGPQSAPWYTKKMKALVAAVRRDLGQSDLPWIVVQIARVFGARQEESIRAWNAVQEQQRLLPEVIDRLEMVAAIDLPLDDFIHIGAAGFPILARRMARVADRMVLRNRSEKRPPRLVGVSEPRMEAGSRVVDLQFADVVGGLTSAGEPSGFSLLDAEGRAQPVIFKTTLHGDIARLHFNLLAGQFLSYGHGITPHCNITDQRGFSLPVFGPVPLFRPAALLPFIRQWKVSPIVTDAPPLGEIAAPDLDLVGWSEKTYGDDGFINEWPQWQGRSGHGYFAAALDLPETMRLVFMMGYDGPFRLWVDGNAFFMDLQGTNPCFPDGSLREIALPKGRHEIRVAMDLNHGRAWGFFLRFERKGLSKARILSGNYAKPSYLV